MRLLVLRQLQLDPVNVDFSNVGRRLQKVGENCIEQLQNCAMQHVDFRARTLKLFVEFVDNGQHVLQEQEIEPCALRMHPFQQFLRFLRDQFVAVIRLLLKIIHQWDPALNYAVHHRLY